MIRPITIDKQSPFLGEECALCKSPLAPGEEIVICPEDGSRHHTHCWQANGCRCTAYGCQGHGEIITSAPALTAAAAANPPAPPSNTQTSRPPRSLQLAQGCLIFSIAIAILLFAVGCFGLWAIADYILVDILGWTYRAPLAGAVLPLIYQLNAWRI